MLENGKFSCYTNRDTSTVSCSGACIFWTCWDNIWAPSPAVLVAPTAPQCGEGYMCAWCMVPSQDEWAVPKGEERRWRKYCPVPSCWVSLCFPLPPSPSSLEIITPNGSGVGHLLWLFPFFHSSSIYSPCLCREEKRCSFCLEGGWRDGSVCFLSGKVLSDTLHVEEIKEQRVVRGMCVCMYSVRIPPVSASIYCPDLNNTRHLNFNQVGCWFCPS